MAQELLKFVISIIVYFLGVIGMILMRFLVKKNYIKKGKTQDYIKRTLSFYSFIFFQIISYGCLFSLLTTNYQIIIALVSCIILTPFLSYILFFQDKI